MHAFTFEALKFLRKFFASIFAKDSDADIANIRAFYHMTGYGLNFYLLPFDRIVLCRTIAANRQGDARSFRAADGLRYIF